MDPDSALARRLVQWFGIYQTGHLFVNTIGLAVLFTGGDLVFPPAPAAMSREVVLLLAGVGVLDTIGAFASLVFVRGYFRRAPWRMWLGTLTTTTLMFSLALYNYWMIVAWSWAPVTVVGYVAVNILTLPIVGLFLLLGRWGATGLFSDVAPRSVETAA